MARDGSDPRQITRVPQDRIEQSLFAELVSDLRQVRPQRFLAFVQAMTRPAFWTSDGAEKLLPALCVTFACEQFPNWRQRLAVLTDDGR
jgi:hypothetical protein